MNSLIRFFKRNKKETELEKALQLLYRHLYVLSNLDEKTFVNYMENKFLPEYEIIKLTALLPTMDTIIKNEIKKKEEKK